MVIFNPVQFKVLDKLDHHDTLNQVRDETETRERKVVRKLILAQGKIFFTGVTIVFFLN